MSKEVALKKESPVFDINKLVAKAQEAYPKKELGLARMLSTGGSLTEFSDDDDFVLWHDSCLFICKQLYYEKIINYYFNNSLINSIIRNEKRF